MQVKILSRELIKPFLSTPPILQNYKISLVDELSPIQNVPIIFYYSVDAQNSYNYQDIATVDSRINILKKSLSKVLTGFYPLAGRYMKECYTVDCSDQGADFVIAKANIRLDDLLTQKKNLKVDLLNKLLPCPIGAADEITDPLLAVQVTMFACGGSVIGVCISHRVVDVSTIDILMNAWALDARQEVGQVNVNYSPISPSWNLASLFPGQKLSGLPFGLSRAKENVEDHNIITKMFSFNENAISRIREKSRIGNSSDERLPSRLQSVFGIIGKAIIDLHAANPGNPRGFLAIQTVNMKERTDPPLLRNQFGNLYLVATAQSAIPEGGIEFGSFVDLLSDSVRKAVEDCKLILSGGDDGQMMITPGFNDFTNTLSDPGISVCILSTDWCKTSFYEVDFGWGKPNWVSSANVPIRNGVYLLRDKSGKGIEAWVSLDVHDMLKFEKDCSILEFTA